MRIGMFSNTYKPIVSGVVRSIDLYRKGLLSKGHFVGLFTSEAKDYRDEDPYIFRYPAINLPAPAEYSLPVVAAAPHINWLLPRLKLDVIHAQHPLILGREALNFSRSEGIPLVFTFHTLYHEYVHYYGIDADFIGNAIMRYVGDFASKADIVIAPSERVKKLLPELHVQCHSEVLPTPIDLSLFPDRTQPVFSNPDRIQLIYVGRIAKEKNLKFLLLAFARAAAQDARLHLRIVGDGPDMGNIKSLTEKLGLGNRVDFIGYVAFDQVPAELLKADLFVFASLTETQGLVILEAMAAGLPQVLLAFDSLLDFSRPGVDSWAVPEDEAAFAAAILALARDPARAQAMGASARSRAQEYSIPSLTTRLLDIYQHAIDHFYAH